MDYQNVTRLLLRIAGLIIVVFAVVTAPTHIRYAMTLAEQDAPLLARMAAGTLPIAFPLLVGMLMFAMPGSFSNAILHGAPMSETSGKFITQIESVALSVVGIYLVIQSLADAAYFYSKLRLYYSYIETNVSYAPPILPDDFAQLIATAIQFFLAVALVIGGPTLTRFKAKLLASRGTPLHRLDE